MISRLSVLLWAGLFAQLAWGVTFRAAIDDSRWDLEASKFNCRLSQPVPDYGRALFEQEAGEEVRFRLQPVQRIAAMGEALLVAEAPPWRPGTVTHVIGSVRVDNASGEISVDPPYARQMLAYLHQGLVPTFTRAGWQGTSEPLRVGVSAANFPSAYREYSGCIEGLLPVNYTQVARTALLFPSATTELSDAARKRLDLIALYIRNDNEVRSVYVDGHSDSLGRRLLNRDLSKKRAESVTRYLVEQGVDEAMITTRYHGERYPVVSNSSPANRDRNRRVTVRLERD